LYAKSFHRPKAQAVEPILTCNTSTDAYSRRVVPFGGSEHNIFTSSPSKPPKTPFLGTYNGKPMGNIYSHNCMMHRDTMLKFGTLFDLAKDLEHQWRRQEFFSRGARSLFPAFPFLPPFPFPSSPLSLPPSPLPLPSLSLPSKRGGRQVERPSPSLPSPPLLSPPLLSCPLPFPPLRSRPP